MYKKTFRWRRPASIALCLLTISVGLYFYVDHQFRSLFEFCKDYSESELRPLGYDFQYSEIPNLYFVPKNNSSEFNSLGMNDREYEPVKGENTFRIMVLGDSITEKDVYVGRNRDNLYHEIIERKFNERKTEKHFEVWNTGVRKYNTVQEYLYFKNKFLKYEPDLLILGYLEYNDYDPARLIYDEKYSREQNCVLATVPRLFGISAEIHESMSRNKFYVLSTWVGYNIMSRIDPEKYPALLFFKDDKSMEIRDKNREALLELKKLADENGFELVVVVFPLLVENYQRDTWLQKTLIKDFEFIDLYTIFNNSGYKMSELRAGPEDVFHPGIEGHQLAADAIERHLISEKLVP